MTRPDRFKYVRKLLKPDGCVFCNAREAGVSFESLCLYLDDQAMVIINKFPYNSGHLLVLPHRHCGRLADLSAEEYDHLSRLLLFTVKTVENIFECPGFNVGLNHGSVAGAGIPEHLHWHVIPRWHGDTNFFPVIAETKVLPETLEQTYERLKDSFREVHL